MVCIYLLKVKLIIIGIAQAFLYFHLNLIINSPKNVF